MKPPVNSVIKIYDTTLRDGTQGEGISFSVTDKLRIAEKLDQFGVDYIEGGFPGSNPRDITFFQEAKKLKLRHARLAAFGSTRRAGVKAGEDAQLRALLDSGMPVITIVGKTWTLHGDSGHAVLEGVDPQPDEDTDAQRLLHDRLGWDVPLAARRAWVRGLRASGSPASVQYDEANLPAVIEQDGWHVEYRDWFADRDPPLPRKVFASRGDARVRMAIEGWNTDE